MRHRVLIVDDDPVLARTLVRVLSERFEVRPSGSEDAIEHLTRERFDAIVTDVLMPIFDGVQLYRWIRNARPALAPRVIFMSGLDRDALARKLGALPNPVLFKPFDGDAVIAALDSVLSS